MSDLPERLWLEPDKNVFAVHDIKPTDDEVLDPDQVVEYVGPQALDALLEKAVKAALEEAATKTFSSDALAPEPERPYDDWGDQVADTAERHARLRVDHFAWNLAKKIRAIDHAAIVQKVKAKTPGD